MFPKETRILIVDDLKTIRVLLTETLANLGYQDVDEACDGKDAFAKMMAAAEKEQPYGFVVSDWNMPGMDGLELLQARNQEPLLQETPFLMITVEHERECLLKAMALGVSDFAVKPFSEKTIADKMASIWNRHNPEQ